MPVWCPVEWVFDDLETSLERVYSFGTYIVHSWGTFYCVVNCTTWFCLDYHSLNLLYLYFMAKFKFVGHNIFTIASVTVIWMTAVCLMRFLFFWYLEPSHYSNSLLCWVYLCFTSWFLNYSMLIEGYVHKRNVCGTV